MQPFARVMRLSDMALSPETEAVTLREQVAQLLADNTHLRAQLQEVLALVGQLRGTIENQQGHIAKLVKMTFGRKTERLEGPTLFDDPPQEPVPPASEALVPDPGVLVPRRKGHGRKPNAADLPRRREVIDLTDAEKACPCCAGVRVRIGEAIRERLDYTPASIFVRELAQQTYACRSCEQAACDPQIVSADFPPEPVPRSGVGAGLLAQVIVSKYVDHRVQGEAVHEMRVGLSRSGCRIRSQTAEELRRLRAVVGSVLGNGVA